MNTQKGQRMKNLHAFTSHRDNCRRYFAIYSLGGSEARRVEGHVEANRRTWEQVRRGPSVGARIHLGGRGSETPVDVMLDLGVVAIYAGGNAPGLGALCERVGGGQPRNISLTIHNRTLWWKLWHDDGCGNNRRSHRCDGWRRPRVWPWSAGRRKYRPWMCLRDGNIDLNPLDALWGPRLYDYEPVETCTALVPIGQFPGDEYTAEFTLRRATRARRHGPAWARRRTDHGWDVDWTCRDGIPHRNNDWKGGEVYGSSEHVEAAADWLPTAVGQLTEWIKTDRARHRYQPPVTAPPSP